MCQSELTEFFAELTDFTAELSEFSLPKQHSSNSIPPVSYLNLLYPWKVSEFRVVVLGEKIPFGREIQMGLFGWGGVVATVEHSSKLRLQ